MVPSGHGHRQLFSPGHSLPHPPQRLAGTQIGVASTKASISQIVVITGGARAERGQQCQAQPARRNHR